MELEKDFLIRRKREKDVRVRVTEDEKKQINEIAKNKGMTASDYLRHCIISDIKKNT